MKQKTETSLHGLRLLWKPTELCTGLTTIVAIHMKIGMGFILMAKAVLQASGKCCTANRWKNQCSRCVFSTEVEFTIDTYH